MVRAARPQARGMGRLVTGSSHYLMEIALKNSLYLEPLCPYIQALLSTILSPDPRLLRRRIILKGDELPTSV